MKVVAVKCPNCQAPIDDSSRFCSQCGTRVIIDDEAFRMKYTYQEIDDARIREANVREKIRLKELEIEALKLQSEEKQKNLKTKMKLVLIIAFFAVEGLLMFLYYIDWADEYILLALALIVVMAIVLPKIFKSK